MFENIKKCLDEFSSVLSGEDAILGQLNEQEKDIIEYFDFNLAKALIKEDYINAEKVAKFILVAKGLSGEIRFK